MDSITIQALAIGVLAMISLFATFRIVFGELDNSTRRAMVVGSGAAGLLTTVFLWDHPISLSISITEDR